MKIVGEHTTADVKMENIEEECREQIQEMVDHEAFQNPVSIMPDTHWGSGAVIGFTMPLGNRVCPNTIGVDIGCGMYAFRLPGNVDIHDWDHRAILDSAIRERVPMGFDVHDWADYHMHEDFPYSWCQAKLDKFNQKTDWHIDHEFGPDYYDDLLERVEYDPARCSNSMGTLGGGNHFIEIGEAENVPQRDEYHLPEPYWCVIHSGSRGIGATIAQYWQERATQLRSVKDTRQFFMDLDDQYYRWLSFDPETVSDEDLLDWVQGGMGQDFVDYDALKEDFGDVAPERIGETKDTLKQALQVADTSDRNTDLDYLEGEEAHGYILDMIFAQTYAHESRRMMAKAVLDAWHSEFFEGYFKNPEQELPPELVGDELDYIERVTSVHNYINFIDGTIRKGACRAYDGQKLIIPFNMKVGTLICEGQGRDSWNDSAPHGAGRAMSRTEAKNRFDATDMEDQTEGVFMSQEPIDEIPGAYKDPDEIEKLIGPTATIVNRITPLISIKAD